MCAVLGRVGLLICYNVFLTFMAVSGFPSFVEEMHVRPHTPRAGGFSLLLCTQAHAYAHTQVYLYMRILIPPGAAHQYPPRKLQQGSRQQFACGRRRPQPRLLRHAADLGQHA